MVVKMATPCTFHRCPDDTGNDWEYRALPIVLAEDALTRAARGSVFCIQRREDGITRRARGWEIGTRIEGDYVPFTYPTRAYAPIVRDTLREAKDTVRRMAQFGASGSAATTWLGMMERGEKRNAGRLMGAWLAGASDVLAQFMPEEDAAPDASWHQTMERQYRAKGDRDAADMHAKDAAKIDSNEARAERGNAAVHLHPDLGKIHDDAREDYATCAGDIVADVLHALAPVDPEEFLADALRTYRGDLAHD